MILFLCSSQPDYLQDLLYAGLAQTIGKANVIEFPHRKSYHEQDLPYPFRVAYAPGPFTKMGFDATVAALREGRFSLVVVGASVLEPFRSYLMLKEAAGALPPTVFVDGGDSHHVGGDAPHGLLLDSGLAQGLVFKRERKKGFAYGPNVHPLSYCVNPDCIPRRDAGNRDWGTFFAMRPSSVTRRRIAEAATAAGLRFVGEGVTDRRRTGLLSRVIRSLRKRTGKVTMDGYVRSIVDGYQFTGDAYLDALRRSRIGISAAGGGFDTLRYWEIPACGALLLSQRPWIEIEDDFVDGDSAAFFEGPDDFVEKVRRWESRPEEAARIAARGTEVLFSKHTTRHRARSFLEVVERELKVRIPGT